MAQEVNTNIFLKTTLSIKLNKKKKNVGFG